MDFFIIGGYAPNEDVTVAGKKSFFNQIEELVGLVHLEEELLIMGNMNGRVVGKTNNMCTGSFADVIQNDNLHKMKKLCIGIDACLLTPISIIRVYTPLRGNNSPRDCNLFWII